jgi:2-keto-4-pentenoate hydratase
MPATPDLAELARKLVEAAETQTPVEPLTARYPDLTLADAYGIQLAIVELRLAAGRKIIGKKIGLSSKVMQELLGVDEPDYGHLFDNMIVPAGEAVAMDGLVRPRCEAEIAFVLGDDLSGPGVTVADVLTATDGVMPALEIVDTRIRDWEIKLEDTVADNGSSALIVLGGTITPVIDLDLRLLGMLFSQNGRTAGTGTGAEALGHPAASVAWLANKLAEFDVTLQAGEIILSGSLAGAPLVSAGDVFVAEFDHLGTVSVGFE